MHCQRYTKAASACQLGPENGKESVKDVSLLQLAADNDVDGLRKAVEGGACVDEPEVWYGRQIGKNEMALEQRTAIMIAALYGSVEVLSYILSLYELYKTDVNLANGSDGLTPLHCAAGGGSTRVAEVVKLLTCHGANANVKDVHGRRPIDVLVVPPQLLHEKATIERMLDDGNVSEMVRTSDVENETFDKEMNDLRDKLKISLTMLEASDADKFCSDYLKMDSLFSASSTGSDYGKMDGFLSASSTDSFSSFGSSSPHFSPLFPSSPKSQGALFERNLCDNHDIILKGYVSDASVPDIKNSIYATDEFRMFSFKIRPCSRAYSHDWTECPFVHPGENARRRDPRRYHYSCVPCPDFRKGACRRGDACEYAHGVFECWLHPAQYRTRLCKDGTSCTRRVCFFAHTPEELRPLFVSTGSAVPSPRASSAFDCISMSPPLQPFSPSPMVMGSPYSPSNKSMNTPPLSPSSSSLRASLGGPWSPPSVPTLHLPGGGLHSSRLRATLSARDVALEDLGEIPDFDPFIASDALSHPIHIRPTPTVVAGGAKSGRLSKYSSLGLNLSPLNLRDLLSSELSSPKAVSHVNSLQELAQLSPKSPHHRSQDQLQMHINALLSPRSSQPALNAQNRGISHGENHSEQLDFFTSSLPASSMGIPGAESKVPGSFAVPLVPDSSLTFNDPKSPYLSKEKGSVRSKDWLRSASPGALSDWGSPSGKPDWGVGHSVGKLQNTSSFSVNGEIEPDLTWAETPVKGSPGDANRIGHSCSGGNAMDGSKENIDWLLEAWMEQNHQNEVVA